ncbi:MAG: DNA gyrase subunit A, partial [Alphaproteobacteria bacterium]|nr:DNA gyrase subunit A [Alphaproteobacteria bacterium]
PTGGIILGRSGIRSAFHTGRGSVVMRAKTNMEPFGKDREAIIVTEIPFQVNKARMVERIAEIVRDKTVEGISDLRDESDRHGVRVVIELKRDATYAVVLAQLFRYTPLQTSFGVNMLALRGQRPELMNIREILVAFVEFREEVITRRTAFELRKARERAHVLAGLLVAISNLDPVIELIRHSPDPATARALLTEKNWPAGDVAPFIALIDEPGRQVVDDHYRLSEMQARAILELRLQRLTGLERDKLSDEAKDLSVRIAEFLEILKNRDRMLEVLREELADIREKFGDDRRTAIEDAEFEHDLEDLIQREEMIITVTHGGYIKRVPLSTYRAQRRGGKGRSGMSTRDEDFVQDVFVSSTHAVVLFFSSRGMVYQLKAYRLPIGTPQARGKAMVNLLPLDEGETISTVMVLPEDEQDWENLHVMFTTASGNVRRNSLSDFTNIMANGKIAMKLDEGDKLVRVRTCTETDDVLLVTRLGMCIRFPVPGVRVFSGRTSTGVRGIRLGTGDNVIAMSILRHAEIEMDVRNAYLRASSSARRAEGDTDSETGDSVTTPPESTLDAAQFETLKENEQFVLAVTEKGFGKRTSAYEYRIANRGGKGIANLEITQRNGNVVSTFPVEPEDQIMLVTDNGQLIRCPIDDVRIASRRTQGVTLFDVGNNAKVVSVTRLRDVGDSEDPAEESDEDEEEDT